MRCFTLEYIRTHKVRQVRIERACGLLAAALAFLLIRALGVTCLIKYFTGIACPTCGMSGAVLCLLNGDFEGYISSNAFALPVGAIICSLVFPELWKKACIYCRRRGGACRKYGLLHRANGNGRVVICRISRAFGIDKLSHRR